MIDTIRVAVVRRILGKGLWRLLRIVIIPKRYAATTHAKLARLTLRNFLSILIEYQCLRIHKRLADWKRLSLRLLACAHISGTDKRLCRSVQVRIYDIRQILSQVIKLFAWKHLTCTASYVLSVATIPIAEGTQRNVEIFFSFIYSINLTGNANSFCGMITIFAQK